MTYSKLILAIDGISFKKNGPIKIEIRQIRNINPSENHESIVVSSNCINLALVEIG